MMQHFHSFYFEKTHKHQMQVLFYFKIRFKKYKIEIPKGIFKKNESFFFTLWQHHETKKIIVQAFFFFSK